jgi:hypothetical protein
MAKGDWRSNSSIGVIALLVIVIAIAIGIWWSRRASTHVLKRVPVIVIDAANLNEPPFEMEISADEKPPYKSPKTGEATVYRALQCQKCYRIYPWKEPVPADNQCLCGARIPTPLSSIPGASVEQK